MKVVLPKRNRLINKLFNTIKADEDKKYLLKENLEYVLNKSLGEIPKYTIEIDKKIGKDKKEKEQNGQYIILEDDKIKKYIFFSYEFPEETRNGYIISKMPIAFRTYFFDNTKKEKKLELFLLDINKKYKDMEVYKDVPIFTLENTDEINNYNTFVYKLCKTLNIKIINEKDLPYAKYSNVLKNKQYIYRKNQIYAKTPFKSVQEIKNMRNQLAGKNLKNKSSYILDNNDILAIYGKTFGNNGFEIILIACAIAELAKKENKEVCFLQIKDTQRRKDTQNREAKPITAENRKIMELFGITVYDELNDYEINPEIEIPEDKDSRNQLEFMKNLMHKFGDTDEKECYLCHCNIQKLIIASHIQRICDINKLDLPFAEKRQKAVDANNGLWLCANHDKLFEYGLIYFEKNKMIISDKLTEEQKEFVKDITFNTPTRLIKYNLSMVAEEDVEYNNDEEFYINPEDYNEEMHKYLEIHKNRVIE